MNIQVTHDGKTYNFENGAEVFIFDIGICHEMPDNQLIAFVSLVYECYLKDINDTPLGKFSDFVAMEWDRLKSLSRYDILTEFYSRY